MNLLYIFQCPFGKPNSKVGKTGHPGVRLGGYQNSYSFDGHVAQFDYAFVGTKSAVSKLEIRLKQEYNWDIERDGRGHSEWVSNHTSKQILKKVQETIDSCHYKVRMVPKEFLPITVDKLDDLQIWLTNNP